MNVAFILVNNGTVKVHCESEKKTRHSTHVDNFVKY